MTCTLSAFIPDIRAVLRDTAAGPGGSTYYDDAAILSGAVDAFRHLHSVRPVSRYGSDLRLNDPAFPSDAQQLAAFSVEFDPRWRLGVVYYAAARCYERDIKDTVHQQLAVQLKQQADQEFAL